MRSRPGTSLLQSRAAKAGGRRRHREPRRHRRRFAGLRPELAELRARVAATRDAGRPEATERRHAAGRRTARENIEDLCDPGSFEEYGGLVIAAQRARRSTADLRAHTPADGLIAGIGRVNGDPLRRACPTTTPSWPAPRAR